MGLRFQKRLRILPGLRLNLSKRGVSASVGPRGADVNIGRGGITTNAGIPGTGLSYRAKLNKHGGTLGVLAVIAGLGFWGFQHWNRNEPAPKATVRAEHPPAAAAQPVTGSSIRYVHRGGSVLRETERKSGKSLKKEPKGATVTALQIDGDWTKVQDGALDRLAAQQRAGHGPAKINPAILHPALAPTSQQAKPSRMLSSSFWTARRVSATTCRTRSRVGLFAVPSARAVGPIR